MAAGTMYAQTLHAFHGDSAAESIWSKSFGFKLGSVKRMCATKISTRGSDLEDVACRA